ncbi:MAG: acyl-CoA reductase [Endozoicomonas sp.]
MILTQARHEQKEKMNMQCLVPDDRNVNHVLSASHEILSPFSSLVIDFIDSFSGELLSDRALRHHPELIALGFWMRKSSIRKFQQDFLQSNAGKIKLARGTVFHIAPANVDTIFIYSLFLSLLLGNRNIVRVSQKASEQRDLLNGLLNRLLARSEYSLLKDYLFVVGYEHDDRVTGKLSQLCQVRVVWGGDATVEAVGRIPLPPRSSEIRFANKYSFALLDNQVVAGLDKSELNRLAKSFVNDAYAFGQMACSSPRTVIWLGAAGDGRKAFWQAVERQLQSYNHELQAGDCVNKLVAGYSMAIEKACRVESNDNNLVMRVRPDSLEVIFNELHCGSGLFVESSVESLEQLTRMLGPEIQTLSYFGIEKESLSEWTGCGLKGVDRIVPIGKALDFNKVWDGVDLTESLTREITLL